MSPAELSNLTEIHGGSPWGAGTFAGADGSRQPTELELKIATAQGKAFYETVSKVQWLPGAEEKTGSQDTNEAPKASSAPQGKPTSEPEQKEKREKEGPCGLPSKCIIQ